ncbi:hypothetical protein ACQ4PT_017916 [Festuca glaucescens]
MGSGTWRKAYGALKDSTKVGLANFNSEYKDLDIAIVKATNHVECPPKERHLRKILLATTVNRPRADVAYTICTLARRLSKTKNWIVGLVPYLSMSMIFYNLCFIMMILDSDHIFLGSPSWDCSAWVRLYAQYLDERVECFRVLKYDVEADRLLKLPKASGKPEGMSCTNYLVQYALALVLKESFKIYCSINDGIINLVDMYFDMAKIDAIKALEIYKRAGQQAERLSAFYDYCKRLELARTFQFPTLRQETEERSLPSDNEDETPQETEKPVEEETEEPEEPEEEPQTTADLSEEDEPQPLPTTGDLLNLDEELHPMIADLEQSNALALAIVGPGSGNNTTISQDLFAIDKSGWELALVTAPSNHTSQPAGNQLAGGFDKLLLDSLYEDTARRHQIASVTYTGSIATNPFDPNDPFAMSSSFAPPSNVQLAMMSQQQQYYQMQQQEYYQMQQQHQMVMMPPQTYQQQQAQYATNAGLSNPFGDPFSGLVAMANPPKQSNPH